jgi:AcrR family transcriptional regulator
MDSEKSVHERILQAAFELISGKGYAAVSTREIALRAGVAEVTIFRRFTSKENLFRQTAKHYASIPVLEELIPALLDKPLKDGIRQLVYSYLDRLSDNKDWIRIFQLELQRDPDTSQTLFHSFIEELHRVCGSYFSALAQRDPPLSCDPLEAARVFVMLCYGCFQVEDVILGRDHRDPDRQQMIDSMVQIFCNGVSQQPLNH